MTNQILKYPKDTTIAGRSSTLRGSFIKAIVPVIPGSEKQISTCLKKLGQSTNKQLLCSYCGKTATQWDHFRPIVVNKKPSGYITDIYNLVPSCGQCNYSKSGKNWSIWIKNKKAKLSPTTLGVKNLDKKIKILEKFEKWSDHYAKQMPKSFLNSKEFSEYMKSCENLIKLLKKYQIKAEEIKIVLKNHRTK